MKTNEARWAAAMPAAAVGELVNAPALRVGNAVDDPVDDVEAAYPYGLSWPKILVATGFFAALAVLWTNSAAGNERALVLNGVIHFSPVGATAFYWVMAGLSGAMAAAGLVCAYHRLSRRQRVAFSAAGLHVPASRWSSRERVVPYAAITGVDLYTVARQRWLAVRFAGGHADIGASLLPSAAAFDEIADRLGRFVFRPE